MDEAYRLTFVFEGDDVQLDSMERLEMRVPPGDELEQTADSPGHFVELRDAGGGALYRRPIVPPRPRGIEYPAEDGRMEWAPAGQRTVVSVLVPATDEAQSVALVAAAPPRRGLQGLLAAMFAPPRRRDIATVALPQRLAEPQ